MDVILAEGDRGKKGGVTESRAVEPALSTIIMHRAATEDTSGTSLERDINLKYICAIDRTCECV